MQYTGDVLLNCILKTYIILLTYITPISLIKKKIECLVLGSHVYSEHLSAPEGVT